VAAPPCRTWTHRPLTTRAGSTRTRPPPTARAAATAVAVRDGDEASAAATLCEDSDSATDISEAIAGQASLDVDPATVNTGGGNDFSASLLGTVDGEPITSGYVSVYSKTGEEGWCVYMFYAL